MLYGEAGQNQFSNKLTAFTAQEQIENKKLFHKKYNQINVIDDMYYLVGVMFFYLCNYDIMIRLN